MGQGFSDWEGIIAAVATAPLPAGVAVVRLSGEGARLTAARLWPKLVDLPPRVMGWGPLTDAAGEPLDEVLAVWFAAPASFTGEEVVEFHTHGGRAVVQAVLRACLALPGVRQAGPGEFTRRAVQHGKLDLTAAEGLADLIAADTDAQRRQALRQLDGALGERFEGWRSEVLRLLAQVEAAVDFPDEELEVLSAPALAAGLRKLLAEWQEALQETAGERLREGLQLALLGLPNAGKSTLLNLLAGREVAIVSPTAGTTRDVVSSVLEVQGFPVQVLDTAGLRTTGDAIEAEGVRRAEQAARRADVVVLVVDVAALQPVGLGAKIKQLAGAAELPALPAELTPFLQPGRSLLVLSHADAYAGGDLPGVWTVDGETYPCVTANLTEPAARGRLLSALGKLVQQVAGRATEAALLTRERHKEAMRQAVAQVGQALVLLGKAGEQRDGHTVGELVAEDLRAAAAAIGMVTGRVSSEDVLDVVFSTFCIGK
jgi:tRNA modification GTPase